MELHIYPLRPYIRLPSDIRERLGLKVGEKTYVEIKGIGRYYIIFPPYAVRGFYANYPYFNGTLEAVIHGNGKEKISAKIEYDEGQRDIKKFNLWFNENIDSEVVLLSTHTSKKTDLDKRTAVRLELNGDRYRFDIFGRNIDELLGETRRLLMPKEGLYIPHLTWLRLKKAYDFDEGGKIEVRPLEAIENGVPYKNPNLPCILVLCNLEVSGKGIEKISLSERNDTLVFFKAATRFLKSTREDKALFVAAHYRHLEARNGRLYLSKGLIYDYEKKEYEFVVFDKPVEVNYYFKTFWRGSTNVIKINSSNENAIKSFLAEDIISSGETERELLLKLRRYCETNGTPVMVSRGVALVCRDKGITEEALNSYERKIRNKVIIRPLTIATKNRVELYKALMNFKNSLGINFVIAKESISSLGGIYGKHLIVIKLDDIQKAAENILRKLNYKNGGIVVQEFLNKPFLVGERRTMIRIIIAPDSGYYIGGVVHLAKRRYKGSGGEDLEQQVITHRRHKMTLEQFLSILGRKLGTLASGKFRERLLEQSELATKAILEYSAKQYGEKPELILSGVDFVPCYDSKSVLLPYLIEVNSRTGLEWDRAYDINKYVEENLAKYAIPIMVKRASMRFKKNALTKG